MLMVVGRETLLVKELTVQASGPEFDFRAHIKGLTVCCVFVNPREVLGTQR